ncbi:FAD-dependent monooxygenase [Pseudomonas citronellolis]|uniref:FAD-dependent monooxygenase n=1 Tax=Pseudomonas citronellolis TaxID=53408 RepID=UPI000778DC12|nr:FAD-dependent monooxygenase [Pseudomonas citronellolis]AMO75606.1 2,4-dichlorophenol 6-monooxygenase [Pseudomonas citronellolis]WRT82623.1 FAD-dependent monooxygenase [Pseudomonas citronellolis]
MNPQNTSHVIEVPVLIVGGGPSGLTASLLLSRYGIRNLLVNKYRWTANSPRAHITNQRTMEVFRDAGVEAQVVAAASPHELMANNVWATSFSGRELGRLLTWGNAIERKSDYELASPSAMCNIPQHLMEPILANEALRAGSEMRFNNELLDFTQDGEGVTARILDRGTGREFTVRAQYMIGADGARSRVMELLGIPLEGEMGLGCAVNVWLRADLRRYCESRPGVLYWMVQPGNDYWVGSGTFICVRPWNEWVMLFMYDPAQGEPDLGEAAVIERARRVIGDADIPVEILATSKWQINHVVAQRYAEGRVFCCGDAVHRHPPANGLGTNTSVQDAYNLAWKLALVLKGQAGPGLLDSYSAERQPVGRQVVDRAMESVRNMLPISNALGFKPGQSEAEGWNSLHELSADSPLSRERRAALEKAIQLQHYQFSCHGVELGQRYGSGAVLADGSEEPAYTRDRELYYHPTTWPGAHLPHAWLHDTAGRKLSTLDLCGQGRLTLLTGHGGDAWCRAAETLARELGIDLAVRRIGLGLDYEDSYGDWARLREIDEEGCLLVRPDQHVAWRSQGAPADAEAVLLGAVRAVLARG